MHLHVFDMDGTLIKGSTASIEISKHLKCLDKILLLENKLKDGKIDNIFFAKEIINIWKNLNQKDLEIIINKTPWIKNISKTLQNIKDNKEKSILITMSPNFFAEKLLDFGFDEVYSSIFPKLPFKNNKINSDLILESEDKVRIVERIVKKFSLLKKQTIVYGDSISDIPLFLKMSNSVSINGDKELNNISKIIYKGDDLYEAYTIAKSKF